MSDVLFRILVETSDDVTEGVFGMTVVGERDSFSGVHSSFGKNFSPP